MDDRFIPENWKEILMEMEIIAFLCKHPELGFTGNTGPSIGSCPKPDTGNSPEALAEQEIIDSKSQNEIAIYCLPEDTEWQTTIERFSSLGVTERENILKVCREQACDEETIICG